MVQGLEDLAPEGLLDRARRAAGLMDDVARVRIFCHYDPDGTTSATILVRALMRRGKRIHATMAHALDRTSAARLRDESNELLIVSDMGSGQLDLLEGLPYPVIVLDHHKPMRDSETVAHVNPHFFGVDGAREMCGATTTWLFALVLDERNWDLAGVAMAGAIGDKQAVGGFVGVNAALFGEAEDRKVVVPERRLALRDLPLGKALAVSIEPYFRGLSGRPEAPAVCLGDRDALARAEKLLDEYTSKVLGHLVALESTGLFPKKHIQFFYCDDASLAGVVAGTGMQFFFDQTRPTLGLSVLDGVTKVSARGTRAHIAAGLDLAAALREAASEVSGNGGGHNIASGATIPKGKEDRFLSRVDELVGRQLEGAPAKDQ